MAPAIQESMYHRVLRVSAVVCAFVLLFESGLLSESTAYLSMNTHQYLANAVGMSAQIEPTELNMFTAELTRQKTELDAREAALKDREIAIGLNGRPNETSTYVLASILFVMLVLIILNYTLDYLRAKEQRQPAITKTV